MAETYDTIATVSFALGFVMLLVSAVLFFRLHIVRVIEDLTGITNRKAKENLNKERETHGKPPFTTGHMNRLRGLRTGSLRLDKEKMGKTGSFAAPRILSPKTEQISPQSPAAAGAEETPLMPSGTTVLETAWEETSVLTPSGPDRRFILELNMLLIHTNEEI